MSPIPVASRSQLARPVKQSTPRFYGSSSSSSSIQHQAVLPISVEGTLALTGPTNTCLTQAGSTGVPMPHSRPTHSTHPCRTPSSTAAQDSHLPGVYVRSLDGGVLVVVVNTQVCHPMDSPATTHHRRRQVDTQQNRHTIELHKKTNLNSFVDVLYCFPPENCFWMMFHKLLLTMGGTSSARNL